MTCSQYIFDTNQSGTWPISRFRFRALAQFILFSHMLLSPCHICRDEMATLGQELANTGSNPVARHRARKTAHRSHLSLRPMSHTPRSCPWRRLVPRNGVTSHWVSSGSQLDIQAGMACDCGHDVGPCIPVTFNKKVDGLFRHLIVHHEVFKFLRSTLYRHISVQVPVN